MHWRPNVSNTWSVGPGHENRKSAERERSVGLLGSYSPDVLTKWAVYGYGFSHHDALLSDPVKFHRGWPGAGFTHSPFYGLVVSGVIMLLTRNRVWALSYLIGAVAHDFSDTLDSVGVMILFPNGMMIAVADVGAVYARLAPIFRRSRRCRERCRSRATYRSSSVRDT